MVETGSDDNLYVDTSIPPFYAFNYKGKPLLKYFVANIFLDLLLTISRVITTGHQDCMDIHGI